MSRCWVTGWSRRGAQVAEMELPATSWKPALYGLRDRVECWPLNAARIKPVPGRKTDGEGTLDTANPGLLGQVPAHTEHRSGRWLQPIGRQGAKRRPTCWSTLMRPAAL